MKLTRKSGILVHPTSFGGKYGIGDLGDIAYNFIDFLHESGGKLWQILPIGPTSFGDSPYQSFSSFAYNTILISPDILKKKGLLSEKELQIKNFPENYVNYENVYKYKNELYKKAFKNFIPNKKYILFCDENEWLDDYCLFISLKNYFIQKRKISLKNSEYLEYKIKMQKYMKDDEIDDCFFGAVWNSWEDSIANREKKAIEKYKDILQEEINFQKFLQYEFYIQWTELKEYANKREIKIIGDIPIFVSLDSADVWINKDLFFLDEKNIPTIVAGVPPDYFSENGQLWGNPLYNWEIHKKDNFKWWINRIKENLKNVDYIRLDHFRGFESYWAVKYGSKNAINGVWEKGIGSIFFDKLKKEIGYLPIIAEDLGIITKEVYKLRYDFDLAGMKVLQFAFDGDEKNEYLPHNYKNSNYVIYTGTHDNDTTKGWYYSISEKEKDIFRRYLNSPGNNPSWDMIRL
ncbi:MAG: 4-alpha-glucanotransferase, partial [Defluviitaleaceae bacterium]|nr:4-alpha-glucanotransferase [Defluviitaleaceae bacterium]